MSRLKRCPFCAEEIQAAAVVCKHCGRNLPKQPSGPRLSLGKFLVALLGALILIGAFSNNSDSNKSSPAATNQLASVEDRAASEKREADKKAAAKKEAEAKEAECRQDLQCWGEKQSSGASVYCRQPIERLAKYQAEWTDKWYEPKFSRLRWDNKERGTITFIGDKIKFQNGFGAWQPMIYSCTFDGSSNTVISVNAFEGRLD